MSSPLTPRRHGKVIDGKYVWNQQQKLPDYFKNGKEFYPLYLPNRKPGTYEFYMGDSEENLKENILKSSEDWIYKEKKIQYKLNNLGYRGLDFDAHDWKNSIVVFGCSCVFGVGVDEDETLSHYLSQLTGRNVINMGVPGGSNQLFLDNSLVMKRKYGNPYSIIMMYTCTNRLTYYGESGVYHIGLWDHFNDMTNPQHKRYKLIFDNIYEENSHEFITFFNIAQSMREIWSNNTKYFEGSFFEGTSHYGELEDYFPFSNTARDLLHPGATDHKRTAEEIVNKCVEKYGKDYLQPGGVGHNIKLL